MGLLNSTNNHDSTSEMYVAVELTPKASLSAKMRREMETTSFWKHATRQQIMNYLL